MTIAVIGGTGFIGRALVARAVRRGLAPVVVARGAHPVELPQAAIFAPADRSDGARLADIFRRHGVDTVIDIFALSLRNTSAVLAAAARQVAATCC